MNFIHRFNELKDRERGLGELISIVEECLYRAEWQLKLPDLPDEARQFWIHEKQCLERIKDLAQKAWEGEL